MSKAIERVAELLQQVPMLHQLAAEAEAKRRAEALQARRDAIAAYHAAATEQQAARDKLAKAEAKVKALRDKLEAEQQDLTRAHQAAIDAGRRFSNAAHELMALHGESAVELGRYRLQRMAENARTRIAALEDNLIEVAGGGLFRRERPEIRAKLTAAREALKKIEAAHQEVEALGLTQDLTPEELTERVSAILQRAQAGSTATDGKEGAA